MAPYTSAKVCGLGHRCRFWITRLSAQHLSGASDGGMPSSDSRDTERLELFSGGERERKGGQILALSRRFFKVFQFAHGSLGITEVFFLDAFDLARKAL